MRGATECAKRIKPFFGSLRSKVGKVSQPAASDPITQLILGVLSRDMPEARASEGLERLRGVVVDYNELRVIPPIELTALLGDVPEARLKCEDISRALNAVFADEHTVSLERLTGLPKKEVQAVLEGIDGLEAYTRARVRLLGLRQHAIPLDEAMWALVRRERLVDPRCPLHEAQQFFERQVSEEDALEFVALLKKHAWAEMGTAVRKREVERIHSVPPDRTSRNMLQLVGRLAVPEAALREADEPATELSETDLTLAADASTTGSTVAAPRPARTRRSRAPTQVAPKARRAAPSKPLAKGETRTTRGATSGPRAARSTQRTPASKAPRSRGPARARTSRSVGKAARKAKSA